MTGTSQSEIERVCIITSRVDIGAFANIANALAAGLAARGLTVDILHVEGRIGTQIGEVVSHRIGGRSSTSFIHIARHLRRTKPQLVISLGWLLNGPAVVAALISGQRSRVLLNEQSVMSYKAFVEHRSQRRLRAIPRVARAVYPMADGLTAVAEDVIDDLRSTIMVSGRLPMRVLSNPVDLARVRRLATPAAHPPGRPHLVNVGRLAQQKNQALLVDAFRLLLPKHPDAKLTLIGSGPLESELRQKAADLGSSVRFAGYLANPFPEMASADLFVLSSEEEGFGLVLVEAMALGVPVVATNCPGGVRTVLLDGAAGSLVPPGDVAALSHAIEVLVDDQDRCRALRSSGLNRAESFTPDAIAEQWLQFADSLKATSSLERMRRGISALTSRLVRGPRRSGCRR